jgi:hypothetical protein
MLYNYKNDKLLDSEDCLSFPIVYNNKEKYPLLYLSSTETPTTPPVLDDSPSEFLGLISNILEKWIELNEQVGCYSCINHTLSCSLLILSVG